MTGGAAGSAAENLSEESYAPADGSSEPTNLKLTFKLKGYDWSVCECE